MERYNYEIILETPLGKRRGTMDLTFDGEKLNGNLALLGKTEACTGTKDKNGFCELSGKIVTLLKEFVYTATGYLDEKHIELTLKSGRNTFELSGLACKSAEACGDAEII